MTCITVNELSFSIDDITPAAGRLSKIVERRIGLIRERSYRTATKQPQKIVLDELSRIYTNCNQPNWDGYDASPVTANTLISAQHLFELLHNSIDVPEVTADPDGDIAFEWNNGRNSLTVAVNSSGQIAYAAYFGDNATTHGSEEDSDSAAETIRRQIDRVYRSKNIR